MLFTIRQRNIAPKCHSGLVFQAREKSDRPSSRNLVNLAAIAAIRDRAQWKQSDRPRTEMYVYRTEQFDREVAKQSHLAAAVDRLCAELETASCEQAQTRFERIYPYLKRKEGNLRLIARIRRLGSEPILCWLAVFRRGDRAYEDFLRTREAYSHHALESDIDDRRLRQWLARQTPSASPTLPHPLPPCLQHWLERPRWAIDPEGVVVYESQSWLHAFRTPDIRQAGGAYSRLIARIADAPPEFGTVVATTESGMAIRGYGDRTGYVLYARLTPVGEPPRQVLFLLAPYLQAPTGEDIVKIVRREIPEVNSSGDALRAKARRAYPSYLLADEQIWQILEAQESINLALSAEEEAVLHSVSTNTPSLPLFLNGRAGSGKSTLLWYLFADYCDRHLRDCRGRGIDDPFSIVHPLFFANNERLLPVARDRVTAILKYHHHFLDNLENGRTLPDLTPCFQPLRSFFRNQLPPQERDRFREENYISFHRFRQLCRHSWRGISPEKAWFTIRSLIKGYHLDDRDTYLTPEDYQEIPAKERAVSLTEFTEIYNRVWKWYRDRARKYCEWDDQDLIRRVLQLKCCPARYTAIFCDEAQDLTRLQLQAIVSLSAFSRFDLERQHVESLPFAFAGDPLQTLNPSGFRWASLKAMFHNEVLTAIAPTGTLKLALNFAELESNYRSSCPIVGFSNLIQLWRRLRLSRPEIRPQKARHSGQALPQVFTLDGESPPETLRAALTQTIVLVPCEEGGEADYIRNDELLSQVFGTDRDSVPWNAIGTYAAKGLEFQRAILYKFGDACPPELWDLDAPPNEEIEYFFNKLYVAASRARERLFVVDTAIGMRRLWQNALDPDAVETNLAALAPAERQQWRSHIQCLQPGADPELISGEDLAAIAAAFAAQGWERNDSELLRRAKGAYQCLNCDREALLCEARSLQLDGQLDALTALLGTQIETVRGDRRWRDVLRELAKGIASVLAGQKSLLHESRQRWQERAEVLQCIAERGEFVGSDSRYAWLAGCCYVRAGNPPAAIACWRRCFPRRLAFYRATRVEVRGMPPGLTSVPRDKESDSILTLWQQAGKPRHPNWLQAVAPALAARKYYKNAMVVYGLLDDLENFQSCLASLSPEQRTPELLAKVLRYYLKGEHWSEAIAFLENHPSLSVAAISEWAYSTLEPTAIDADLRRRLLAAIHKRLSGTWQQEIPPAHVGIVFEKIGRFPETLQFYEGLLNADEAQVRDFARKRWLAVKRKQELYARKQSKGEKADKIRQEIAGRAREWGIQAQSISLKPPALAKVEKSSQSTGEGSSEVSVKLPQIATVEPIAAGMLKFRVKHLIVQVMSGKQVLITDSLSREILHIDGQSQQVRIGSMTVKATGNSPVLTFTDIAGSYSGLLIQNAQPPQLQLKVQGVHDTIVVSL